MADAFTYHFDWDPAKAAENLTRHGVSFRLATTVFRDALALTVYDDEHSQTEERWASIGHAENGQTLVVIHTTKRSAPPKRVSASFPRAPRTEAKSPITRTRRADLRDQESNP